MSDGLPVPTHGGPQVESNESETGHVDLELRVNGEAVQRTVPAETRLAGFLRDHLRLTGTKIACEVGVCGVCTVLLDGKPISSCLLLAWQACGREVTSIEGLLTDPNVQRLRDRLIEEGGVQCGFCTSGQVVAAAALMASSDGPATRQEIVEAMEGNLCRCTGYYGILRALGDPESVT